MKAVLGWLADPYVHMFAVGLGLVWLAMGSGGDAAPVGSNVRCQRCMKAHVGEGPCQPTVAITVPAVTRSN